MRDYDALLSAARVAQLEKLEANGHKRGFEDVDLIYSYRRLRDEVIELNSEFGSPLWDIEKIRHEAADIANFAAMIIYKCDQILEEKI